MTSYKPEAFPALLTVAGKARRKKVPKKTWSPPKRIPVITRPSLLAQHPVRVHVATAKRIRFRDQQIMLNSLHEFEKVGAAYIAADKLVDQIISDVLAEFNL